MRQQILMVDDQQSAMRYHWSALERAGYELTRCDTT
jgi:DNA-binding NtrC family response regulator